MLLFLAGAQAQKGGVFGKVIRPIIEANVKLPARWWAGYSIKPPHLALGIKFKHYQTLQAHRSKALGQGVLFASGDDFVPATVEMDGKTFGAKLRLKGDSTEHLLGDKWSLRVKLRGANTVLGMRTFSLHHPSTRNWAHEWLLHRWLKREGVVALRYHFVEVSLNGEEMGVYALEEHFDHRLLEHQSRREGPIIRFSEGPMWRALADQGRAFEGVAQSGYGDYVASPIEGFHAKRIAGSETLRKQQDAAFAMLEAFRQGTLPASRVFDVDKLGTYLAIADITAAHHATLWHNTRMYYNPLSARLEPVGFDGNAGHPISAPLAFRTWYDQAGDVLHMNHQRYWAQLFSDPVVFKDYVRKLERFTQPEYLQALLTDLDAPLQEALAVLWREFPQYRFNTDVYARNQAYLRTVFSPAFALRAHVSDVREGGVDLTLLNLQRLPLEVLEILVDGQRPIVPAQAIVLPGRTDGQPLRGVTAPFLAAGLTEPQLMAGHPRIRYRILGATTSTTTAIGPRARDVSDYVPRAPVHQLPNAAAQPFLVIDEARRTILVRPGEHRIDHDVILPPGYLVEAGPGTSLDLVQGSLLLSRSRLRFIGDAAAPIRIVSSDGTGQGLVVLTATSASELRHVQFDNLGFPDRTDWALTGAITFMGSPVLFDHCRISRARAEDALNGVQTSVTLRSTVVETTLSDAFDCDFCTASVFDSTFIDCGNDCIDVSGSHLTVQRLRIKGAGDKAISIGEASTAELDDIDVVKANVGVAAKDRSSATLNNLRLRECRYGLVCLQKKPEYGPASLFAKNVSAPGAEHLAEPGSQVVIDGVPVPAAPGPVAEALYP